MDLLRLFGVPYVVAPMEAEVRGDLGCPCPSLPACVRSLGGLGVGDCRGPRLFRGSSCRVVWFRGEGVGDAGGMDQLETSCLSGGVLCGCLGAILVFDRLLVPIVGLLRVEAICCRACSWGAWGYACPGRALELSGVEARVVCSESSRPPLPFLPLVMALPTMTRRFHVYRRT